jgi:hypothetical protein
MNLQLQVLMSKSQKKQRSRAKPKGPVPIVHKASGGRFRIPPGAELDSICAAICTRVMRGLQEEASSHLEILNDPRLLRLVVSRARATGDIHGAFEDSVKALKRLRMIEDRRR